ncbi:hypothetical protein ACF0H5_005015 [Mactra antiquata]
MDSLFNAFIVLLCLLLESDIFFSICSAMRRNTLTVTKASVSKDDDSTKKQVIKMLVAIIVTFLICWAPITVNNLLVAFRILPTLHLGYVKYMREAFHVMSYFNSCVNPIVYGFMSKNFRQTFQKSLCGCLRGKEYIRRQVFRSQTEVSYLGDDHYPTRWTCSEQRNMLSNQNTLDDHGDHIVYEVSDEDITGV